MSEPLEPLDPSLAKLFESERAAVEHATVDPALVDDAIARAVERATSLAPSPGGVDPPPPGASPAVGNAGAGVVYGAKALLAAAVAGALVGSSITYAVVSRPDAPRVVPTPPVASAPLELTPLDAAAPSAPSAEPSASAPPPSLSASGRGAAPSPAASTTAPAASDLVRERELVDAARASLGQGKAPEALRLLREHESRFARGQLTEERDALLVLALARAGQPAQARDKLRAFRAAHPKSPLLPSLEREVPGADASP